MRKLLTILILLTIFASALIGIFLKIHANLEKETLNKPPEKLKSEKLFTLINEWRIRSGRSAYIQSEDLCLIAKDRANDIPILDNHRGFIEKYSSYPYMLQENLSGLDPTEEKVLIGWLNSLGHRQTLEKPYTHSCVVCDRQCVQIFSSFER